MGQSSCRGGDAVEDAEHGLDLAVGSKHGDVESGYRGVRSFGAQLPGGAALAPVAVHRSDEAKAEGRELALYRGDRGVCSE